MPALPVLSGKGKKSLRRSAEIVFLFHKIWHCLEGYLIKCLWPLIVLKPNVLWFPYSYSCKRSSWLQPSMMDYCTHMMLPKPAHYSWCLHKSGNTGKSLQRIRKQLKCPQNPTVHESVSATLFECTLMNLYLLHILSVSLDLLKTHYFKKRPLSTFESFYF